MLYPNQLGRYDPKSLARSWPAGKPRCPRTGIPRSLSPLAPSSPPRSHRGGEAGRGGPFTYLWRLPPFGSRRFQLPPGPEEEEESGDPQDPQERQRQPPTHPPHLEFGEEEGSGGGGEKSLPGFGKAGRRGGVGADGQRFPPLLAGESAAGGMSSGEPREGARRSNTSPPGAARERRRSRRGLQAELAVPGRPPCVGLAGQGGGSWRGGAGGGETERMGLPAAGSEQRGTPAALPAAGSRAPREGIPRGSSHWPKRESFYPRLYWHRFRMKSRPQIGPPCFLLPWEE